MVFVREDVVKGRPCRSDPCKPKNGSCWIAWLPCFSAGSCLFDLIDGLLDCFYRNLFVAHHSKKDALFSFVTSASRISSMILGCFVREYVSVSVGRYVVGICCDL